MPRRVNTDAALEKVDDEIVNAIPTPKRSMAPIQWYGGKGSMVAKIAPYLRYSKVYVEPYCGAASIFWSLSPRPVEVLNDLDGDLINLFRVLQHKSSFKELYHRIVWTPYSLEEFRLALDRSKHTTTIDRAWAFYVRCNQGFSGIAKTEGHWSRSRTSLRGMASNVSNFNTRLSLLKTWHKRLTRVQIDNRDALDVIQYWDSPDTTFYIDPPYVASTRISKKVYHTEKTDSDHEQLVKILLAIKGAAIVSGYYSPIYDPLKEAGWKVRAFETVSHVTSNPADKLRTELLWIKRYPT